MVVWENSIPPGCSLRLVERVFLADVTRRSQRIAFCRDPVISSEIVLRREPFGVRGQRLSGLGHEATFCSLDPHHSRVSAR